MICIVYMVIAVFMLRELGSNHVLNFVDNCTK